jgi:putative transposase
MTRWRISRRRQEERERSIARLGRQRRLSKDYERRPATSEALVYLAGIRLLLARLTRP